MYQSDHTEEEKEKDICKVNNSMKVILKDRKYYDRKQIR